RSDCHWPLPHTDSLDRDPRDEPFSQSSSQHRAGRVCGRLCAHATLVVLGSAHFGWSHGGDHLQVAVFRGVEEGHLAPGSLGGQGVRTTCPRACPASKYRKASVTSLRGNVRSTTGLSLPCSLRVRRASKFET